MNNTAEVYLWGTRIGIIHQESGLCGYELAAGKNMGLKEKTIKNIETILEQNRID